MIYDSLNNIERYKGISKNLDKAIDFIRNVDLSDLNIGKIEIDGEKVFANVMEATTKDSEETCFEIHHKYMDIQIDIIGTEMIEIGIGELEQIEPYDESKDIGFYKAKNSQTCVMGYNKFMICMVGEPHKPGVNVNNKELIKKCVIKVAQ